MAGQDIGSWLAGKTRREGACLVWQGTRTPFGYGRGSVNGVGVYAHHVALELDGRPRPPGAVAMHSCDNPPCVEPSHLRWGTQKENVADCFAKGRADTTGRVAGEKNGNAILCEKQVLEIRNATGYHKDIAARYGVSRSLIGAIKTKQAWRHL